MIGCVGIELRLKAKTGMLNKRQRIFTDYRAVKEVAGIKLNAGHIGMNLHCYAACLFAHCYNRSCIVVKTEVVVISSAHNKLLVVCTYIFADFFALGKIKRSAADISYFTGGYAVAIGGGK